MSRLQNAVRRPAEPRDQYADDEPHRQPAQRERYRVQPEPAHYDDVEGFDEYDEPGDDRYMDADSEEQEWEEPAPRQRQAPRRSSSRQPIRQPRQRTRPTAPDPIMYEDDDEELYNDDPYLGYEDDQIDRRLVRPARQRSQGKISKPNLPKITIPRSVSESPLLTDTPALIMLGIAILSVALMSFIVSDRVNQLPQTIPTHVSASGVGENIMTRDAVWQIPLLAGMVMLMNAAASWFIARIDQFATRFLLAGGLLVHFIAWVAVFKYLWD